MKTIINILRLSVACAASLLMLASCDTDVESIDINQPGIESQKPRAVQAVSRQTQGLQTVGTQDYVCRFRQ